ncbi:MAG: DNA-processing protein DprA [Rhodoferax sp.]|uniref:DNA-processing protein DprA n=1 Tax=Rhodoferax sp. TaxID=50421 RepID=UPI0026396103|nr:DNA-processing protein DprA [Rhodoferax sp.]MDD2881559.1 DNA-processing protein DprA [Rhodoferax sp.]
MEREELAAWLRLTLTPGVGNATARKLLGAFGLPQAIFEQPTSALGQVASSAQVAALRSTPPELDALVNTTWAWLQQDAPAGIRHQIVALGDSGYPQTLLSLDDPPLMLYLLGVGKFKEISPVALINNAQVAIYNIAIKCAIDPALSLAVVGSRNPTPQGLANARLFAKAIAQAGLTVVSGLALGVDGAAHEGALEGVSATAGVGATVAVVGTGLDRVYPRAHRDLAHRIAAHGLLVSEYPLGTPPLTANFPKRNRLIAGLSNGTLVVEAALKSGSLITARLTSEQGKDVFAIPGSIHAAQSRGCHALIKQGAKLVESAQDILEELKWPMGMSIATTSIAGSAYDETTTGLFDENSALLAALGFDPVGLDALQARCGLDTSDLQAQLMGLELDGDVARLPGGLFQRLARV